MTSTKTKYRLSTMDQLIDLNDESVNFDITFTVSSLTKSPFRIVVVNQTTLDNSDEYDFQLAENGVMSGQVVNDKNEFQNHYLVLNSEQENEVEVEILKKELPRTPDFPQIEQRNIIDTRPKYRETKKSNLTFWLLLGLAVAIGGGFLYLHFKNKDSPSGEESVNGSVNGSVQGEGSVNKSVNGSVNGSVKSIQSSIHSSPAPSISSSDTSFSSKSSYNNNFLKRLRKLGM